MNISYPGVLQDAEQTTRFLQRMVDELNLALEQTDEAMQSVRAETTETSEAAKASSENTYNDLRSLIIKTGDIIKDEMSTQVTERLGGYVTTSEYGDLAIYVQEVTEENAQGIKRVNDYAEQISSSFGTFKSRLSGSIQQGVIYVDGEPREGIAIGENLRTLSDGSIDKNNHMAFFTSDKLSFWLNGAEMAYFSDSQMHVSAIVASDSVQIGDWMLIRSAEQGLKLKYIG